VLFCLPRCLLSSNVAPIDDPYTKLNTVNRGRLLKTQAFSPGADSDQSASRSLVQRLKRDSSACKSCRVRFAWPRRFQMRCKVLLSVASAAIGLNSVGCLADTSNMPVTATVLA